MSSFNKKNIAVSFLFVLLSTLCFSKGKGDQIFFPEEILTKIEETEETTQSWYICKIVKNLEIGEVILGPLENQEQAYAGWIYLQIPPGKNNCIAKNLTYRTSNPQSYDYKLYNRIYDDYSNHTPEDYLNYYFMGIPYPKPENPEEDSIKTENSSETPEKTEAPSNSSSDSSQEKKSVLEPGILKTLTENMDEDKENPVEQINESEIPAETPAVIPVQEKPKFEIPVPQKQNALPEKTKEEKKSPQIPVPVFTPGQENIQRYQKEYLQDYAPKKNKELPLVQQNKNITISNPDEIDESGRTLLMNAAKDSDLPFLKLLLNSGADVNITDKDGWTALMYAVRYQSNLEIVEELISHKAEFRISSNYGITPLYLAALYNDNPKILGILLNKYQFQEKEVQKTFIHLIMDNSAVESVKIEKIKAYIKAGLRLNVFYNGKTPLMYACQYGNSTAIIKILIENKADKFIRSTEGLTAFEYAEQNQNLPKDDIYWELNGK